MQKPGEE